MAQGETGSTVAVIIAVVASVEGGDMKAVVPACKGEVTTEVTDVTITATTKATVEETKTSTVDMEAAEGIMSMNGPGEERLMVRATEEAVVESMIEVGKGKTAEVIGLEVRKRRKQEIKERELSGREEGGISGKSKAREDQDSVEIGRNIQI